MNSHLNRSPFGEGTRLSTGLGAFDSRIAWEQLLIAWRKHQAESNARYLKEQARWTEKNQRLRAKAAADRIAEDH